MLALSSQVKTRFSLKNEDRKDQNTGLYGFALPVPIWRHPGVDSRLTVSIAHRNIFCSPGPLVARVSHPVKGARLPRALVVKAVLLKHDHIVVPGGAFKLNFILKKVLLIRQIVSLICCFNIKLINKIPCRLQATEEARWQPGRRCAPGCSTRQISARDRFHFWLRSGSRFEAPLQFEARNYY